MFKRVLFKSAFCLSAFAAGLAWGAVAEAEISEPAPRSVQCSAAFELMQRAAPDWASQHTVQSAREFWRADLGQLAARAGLDAETQIASEMVDMAEASISNPGIITDTAMQCVGDAELPKRRKILGLF